MSRGPEPGLPGDEVLISRFPIHRACRDGDVGALLSLSQQLSSRAHLTAEDSCYGWSPIHWAAHYGQLECVVRLVQMGCGVNTATSRFDQTPAHTAAFGGRPHCVVWLSQAGADVNKQDFVGETPIHKAARSGSLECIQVLLIAGAKPHLRNAEGQTAADLARAHGFHDCFHLISKARRHLLQLDGPPMNGAPGGQDPFSRKRLPATVDAGHVKKARRAENVLQSGGGEDSDSMNTEEFGSGDTEAFLDADRCPSPHDPAQSLPLTPPLADQRVASAPLADQRVAAAPQRSFTDMCGSLHLTGSPSSCVSHRPAWWGCLGAECGDSLHYGHYHGFGDTAEELGDGGVGVQAEHKHNQAIDLYNSS